MRGLRASTTLLVLILVCAACGRSSNDVAEPGAEDGVRIASFDFAESGLLAELYAQVLDAAGVPVIRLGVVGPREIVAPSLELDRLDLVPEYLGTAIRFFGDTTDSEGVDSTQASTGALQRLLTPRGLVALDAADAQNSNAIVVTSEFAMEGDMVTISDLARQATTLRFGGPVECPDRPLCLLGLIEVYGLEFAEFVPQRSVALTAEALRRDEIEVGLAFMTSPVLDDDAFTVLEDDRRLQPSENVIPVIRRSALDRWGAEVGQALDGLSALLTTRDLRAMNRRVADGTGVAEVASSWLADAAHD
jgi:osmoprotectant transport system substrate-binding protein